MRRCICCVRVALHSLIRAGPGRGQAQFPRRPPNRGGGFEIVAVPQNRAACVLNLHPVPPPVLENSCEGPPKICQFLIWRTPPPFKSVYFLAFRHFAPAQVPPKSASFLQTPTKNAKNEKTIAFKTKATPHSLKTPKQPILRRPAKYTDLNGGGGVLHAFFILLYIYKFRFCMQHPPPPFKSVYFQGFRQIDWWGVGCLCGYS